MPEIPEHLLTVETARFGPFTFQIGLDAAAVEIPLLRIGDAQDRFRASPLAQVASRLEREVAVASVFGTNTIEGGTLSEEETGLALDLDPSDVRDMEQRRVLNIKSAYDLASRSVAEPDWRLTLSFVRSLHAAITDGIPHERNLPGVLRDNPKEILTHVGDQAHGGRYKPPQYGGDVRLLLDSLIEWHQSLVDLNVPVLIRAPLVHYYYELIHPFWDGNGRVGRVIEASLLLREGFRYAPFTLARFYLDRIDSYFASFNSCRKAADRGAPYPNTDFVLLFLHGMLTSLSVLHDRVNALVGQLLFASDIKRRLDEKLINIRQYAILGQLLEADGALSLAEMRRAPWYRALYARLTDKTKQRDLRGLREQGLAGMDEANRLWVEYDRQPAGGWPKATGRT